MIDRIPSAAGTQAADVLEFWFADGMQERWFRADPDFDAIIRRRFEGLWLDSARGKLDNWTETATGALALVIVLDQFPLNIFRGRPTAFVTEARAIAVSKNAVARGFDQELRREQVAFLYMPLMHSEALEDQERVVVLFEAAGLEGNLRFAQHHRNLVRRFGRFPHRNRILGRSSTTEELAYLASDEAFLG